ncbi:CobD/CbiB family cobalamin biosynthesis protein [Colwellia sp. D2M02]|uniref:cobalamin biosynthesis protein CobD/CbiB n=1 Tax=Colwellia sp. D2M02 TaxID=2841562 RepID=UPI0020913894|nr:CobD/CbiB family cobalamin biosynthesis protein [Colwellia sp. D2M02]
MSSAAAVISAVNLGYYEEFLVSLLNEIVLPDAYSVIVGCSVSITLLLALIFDACFGEAKKYHYLVGFGYIAQWLEQRLNPDFIAKPIKPIKSNNDDTDVFAEEDLAVTSNNSFSASSSKVATGTNQEPQFSIKSALLGGCAWLLMVLPIPLFYWFFLNDFIWYWQLLLDAVVLYLAIGLHSLHQHAMQVYQPLKNNNLVQARHFTGYLVSRDTTALSPQAMSRATVESMLENGHDSVIASLFYYVIGGAPLVILHRFANTLDAMWGYKSARFFSFGYVSARLDDLLGFASAKVCTLLYAIQGSIYGRFKCSVSNAFKQGNYYKSHNGGWVMAAGATVMNVLLGGSANYHGKTISSVTLGVGEQVNLDDIMRSVKLVKVAALLLLLSVFSGQLVAMLLISH